MCFGGDAAALARRQRAVIAGAPEAVAMAMQDHPGDAAVQSKGQVLRDLLARRDPGRADQKSAP